MLIGQFVGQLMSDQSQVSNYPGHTFRMILSVQYLEIPYMSARVLIEMLTHFNIATLGCLGRECLVFRKKKIVLFYYVFSFFYLFSDILYCDIEKKNKSSFAKQFTLNHKIFS